MGPNRVSLRTNLCGLLLCLTTSAFAQGQGAAPRQPQGLFGAEKSDANATTKVDVSASLIEGYDSDVPLALRPTIDPTGLQSNGLSTTFSGTAGYEWRGTRTQVGADAFSAIRHYVDLGATQSIGHGVGLGLSTRTPGRLTLMVNQSAAYSPTYFSGLFPTGSSVSPGNPGTTSPDYALNDLASYTYATTMSVRHDINRRSNLTFAGDFDYTDRLRESEFWRDVTSHTARGQYSRNFSQHLALSTQYHYRSGEFGYAGLGRTTEHGLDVGISLTRPLSPSRRASFRFNVGGSGADVPESIEGLQVIRRRYLVTGESEVQYPLGRTWQVRGNFRRGVEYVVDIPEPVFSSSLGLSVGGLLTRRLDLTGFAGYSSGASLVNPDVLVYDTYTGDVRVRYGITRQLGAFIEYLYYFYDFRAGRKVPLGVPPGLERNGVRVGMSLWIPTLRR